MQKTQDVSQRVLNAWAISLIVWSVYRATFKTDLPIWIDEFIAKPLVFLGPAFWYITRTEKTSFREGVGLESETPWKDTLIGLGVGSMFILLAVLIRFARGLVFSYTFTPDALIWVLAMGAAAVSVQLLSTGFVLERLMRENAGPAKPILISAVLFSFLHVPAIFGVDKIAGSTLMQMLILNFFVSLTTSFAYVLRKSTIAPIIIHALYFLSLPIMM